MCCNLFSNLLPDNKETAFLKESNMCDVTNGFFDADTKYWEELDRESDLSRQQRELSDHANIISQIRSKLMAFKAQVTRSNFQMTRKNILLQNLHPLKKYIFFCQSARRWCGWRGYSKTSEGLAQPDSVFWPQDVVPDRPEPWTTPRPLPPSSHRCWKIQFLKGLFME